MRNRGLAVVIAILLVASLGIGYLTMSSATRTATSSSATGTRPFTYQTVTSSTVLSTNSTTVNGTTITEMIASVSTSTFIATWFHGQPIPAAMVETDDFPVPDGPFVFNPTTDRIYVLGTSSLTVVDASSHSVVATVPFPENNTGGSANAGLAIDTSADIVYVTTQGEVVEVNGSTNTLVRGLPLSLGTLAFDPATGMLWGTQPFHSRVVEVNVGTGSVVANISVAFEPFEITLDPKTGLVYADGCDTIGLVCSPGEAIVDGTSGAIVATVQLGSPPSMALDPATHIVYVSGEQQFAAFNGITGKVIFNVDPQTCGPFTNMVVDPSANLVYTAPGNSNYLLAYDGATGKLVNMYVFDNSIDQVAFNPSTSELYVHTAGHLIALRPLSSTGNVDTSLIAPRGGFCPLP
jgi:hypothetical protein